MQRSHICSNRGINIFKVYTTQNPISSNLMVRPTTDHQTSATRSDPTISHISEMSTRFDSTSNTRSDPSRVTRPHLYINHQSHDADPTRPGPGSTRPNPTQPDWHTMRRTHVTWDTHTSRLRPTRPDLGLRFETDISAC